MLTQTEADALIGMQKAVMQSPSDSIVLPEPGARLMLQVQEVDGKERFQLDVTRSRRLALWTLQLRYREVETLVRLCGGGPLHHNPRQAPSRALSAFEDLRVAPPHLHVYVEEFGDTWATPLPSAAFTDPEDIGVTWSEFLQFCHVVYVPAQETF